MFTCLLVYLSFFCFLNQNLAQNQPSVDQFLGTNWQFVDGPLDGIDCVTNVRQFVRWVNIQEGTKETFSNTAAEDLYPDECLNLNPVSPGVEGSFDQSYGVMADLNLIVMPTITSTIPAYNQNETGNFLFRENWRPITYGPNPLNPQEIIATEPTDASASYIERADVLYHFIGRYGSGNAANCDLKICDDNDTGSNAGDVTFIESWNEQDRWWTNTQNGIIPEYTQFTPAEYAAMINADIDGAEGTLTGTGTDCNDNTITYPLGVRNVDPNIRVVMGGLANTRYEDMTGAGDIIDNGTFVTAWTYWIEGMRTWFTANRADGNDFPIDVLNFHHYSVDNENLFAAKWRSPEEDEFRLQVQEEIVAEMEGAGWRTANDYRELWISEFGYDTNQETAPNFDFTDFTTNNPDITAENLQAQWNARTFLELYAAGVDRAMVHHFRDAPGGANWDGFTGLISADDEPKESWYFVYGLKNILEGYSFAEDESTEDECNLTAADSDCDADCTRIYRFENEDGNRIWAVWSPSSCGIEYDMQFTDNDLDENWALLRLGSPSIQGIREDLTLINGSITLQVNETPLFILEEGREDAPECPVVLVNNTTCSSASLDIQIPAGQNYDSYQIWYGEYDPATDPVFEPDFGAIEGNLTRFGYDFDGARNNLILDGISPNTSYVIYVIPENGSGTPLIPTINDVDVPCATLLETADDISHCGLPVYDPTFASIEYGSTTQQNTLLFDDQMNGNIDFCSIYLNNLPEPGPQEVPHDMSVFNGGSNWTEWVSFNGNSDVNELTIEFLESNYVIDQLTFFDATSAGLITFEYSLTGEENDYTTLVEYYTNRGERFCLVHEEEINPMTMRYDCITEGFGAWYTLSDFEQPTTGIKFLRVTSTSNEARLTELFICGRPGCPDDNLVVAPVCNTADFAACAESATFSKLEIQGNSGMETLLPNSFSNFNYPSSFFNERGSNQLIPGVTYNPQVETCIEGTCSTETLNFMVPDDSECLLDKSPIDVTARFAGSCGRYILPVDENVEEETQVQVWLSHTVEFNDNTVHPLVRDPNAEMMVLTVETAMMIGKSINFSYDRCEKNVYLAYRYFTESASSPLYNLSLVTSSTVNNNAWQTICKCVGSNAPTPIFIMEDCYLTDIFYRNLEVGEKLQNEEYTIDVNNSSSGSNSNFDIYSSASSNNGTPERLEREQRTINNKNYIYHLEYPETAKSLRFKKKESNPWVVLDLTTIPCMTTNNPPGSAAQNEHTQEANLKVSTSLRLYPNPTQDYLNVEITESAQLLLLGVDGKAHDLRDLKSTSYGYQFSTGHLTPGLYLLRTINESGKVETGKFLVRE